MSRTNGDLDYGNWALFFTGHGAAGGGSDLDQGDTRRDFRANDFGVFVQDDWRLGGGLTLNVGLRYDVFGNLTERNGRIGNYYLPEAAAATRRAARLPGARRTRRSSSPASRRSPSASSSSPGTPVDLSQIHEAPERRRRSAATATTSRPRVGFAWQPSFAPKVVVRGGWGIYYERIGGQLQGRPAACGAVLHLPERAGAGRTWPTRIRG